MNITISKLAKAKLSLYLWEEATNQPLAFRVVPLTSGCSTPSFALELTEVTNGDQNIIQWDGIPFIKQQDAEWMDGLMIDLNRESGKLSVYHPNPTFLADCQLHALNEQHEQSKNHESSMDD